MKHLLVEKQIEVHILTVQEYLNFGYLCGQELSK